MLAVVGVGVYEHKAHAKLSSGGSSGQTGVVNIGGGIHINPNGVHLTPIGFNPGGGNVVSVALNDGDTTRTVKANVGDILNVSLPIGSWVVTADYGAGVVWGTGAADGSKVLSVQLKGPTTITIAWTDTNVPARYTTKVQVTT